MIRLQASGLRKCALAVVLAANGMSLAAAEARSSPSFTSLNQNSPASTFVSESDEVSVDLVARDRKGHSIRDLTANDLSITDNGQPVNLNRLRLVTTGKAEDRLRNMKKTR